jgi:hypothetical protein
MLITRKLVNESETVTGETWMQNYRDMCDLVIVIFYSIYFLNMNGEVNEPTVNSLSASVTVYFLRY